MQPGTAVAVAREHWGQEMTEDEARGLLIFSEKAAIELAAAYLSDLGRTYDIQDDDEALFLAYATSPRSNRALQECDFDLHAAARAFAVAEYATAASLEPSGGFEATGLTLSTITTLLRREDHYESSSRAVIEAGF